MLADSPDTTAQTGSFSSDLHLPATVRYELIDFIAEELPRWRDRTDRPSESAETTLTSQLCGHLNSAARRAAGWDNFQFRVEERDELEKGRKIDLIAAPCGNVIVIEGRRHSDLEPILPIECKRLPTPKDKDRDDREYVITSKSTTGGIQRFKDGYHGKAHKLAAMIAYIQEETTSIWIARIEEWIRELIKTEDSGWTEKDLLRLERNNENQQLALLQSVHKRDHDLGEIELRHLWLVMTLS